MFIWLHKLMNPHCDHCVDHDKSEVLYLRLELSRLQNRYDILLEKMITPVKQLMEPKEVNLEDLQPVRTAPMLWAEKRRMLEENDRANALSIARKKNDELEAKLLAGEQDASKIS